MIKSLLSEARLSRMHQTMAGYIERGEIPGLVMLVNRGGETHVDAIGSLAADGAEPMRRDTIFRIASLTKPITAAAAMILVEDGRLHLDDPVDALLPELANRRVLRSIESSLDDTEPAKRPITLRDLLTFQVGIGMVMAPPGQYPIQIAIAESGLAAGPIPSALTPDEWMASLGSLPLIHQPGEGWMYHTGSDILGVLIARASGQTLGEFLNERIFEPLGMKDTGFFVPAEKLHRLPTAYVTDRENGGVKVYDEPATGHWSRPPVFEGGGGGLVSTVDDYCAFCRMLLDRGQTNAGRILSEHSVELMTSDHTTPQQKEYAPMFFGENRSWGFGMAVPAYQYTDSKIPDRFGWDGGTGTSAYSYPKEDTVAILMTQRLMDSPEPPSVFLRFWASAYKAVED